MITTKFLKFYMATYLYRNFCNFIDKFEIRDRLCVFLHLVQYAVCNFEAKRSQNDQNKKIFFKHVNKNELLFSFRVRNIKL
jgi:hypothetical protein